MTCTATGVPRRARGAALRRVPITLFALDEQVEVEATGASIGG